jgi:hypothetical protein
MRNLEKMDMNSDLFNVNKSVVRVARVSLHVKNTVLIAYPSKYVEDKLCYIVVFRSFVICIDS